MLEPAVSAVGVVTVAGGTTLVGSSIVGGLEGMGLFALFLHPAAALSIIVNKARKKTNSIFMHQLVLLPPTGYNYPTNIE